MSVACLALSEVTDDIDVDKNNESVGPQFKNEDPGELETPTVGPMLQVPAESVRDDKTLSRGELTLRSGIGISPASDPGLDLDRGVRVCSLDNLLTMESSSGGHRVDFVIPVDGKQAKMLWDTGGRDKYVSADFVKRHGLKTTRFQDATYVEGAFGKVVQCDEVCVLRFRINTLHFAETCRVVPLSSYDVILGMTWINRFVKTTTWGTGEWELHDGKGGRTKFYPDRLPAPKEVRHDLSVIENKTNTLELTRSGFRRFCRQRRVDIVMFQPVERLQPVQEVEGPREGGSARLPTLAPMSEALRLKVDNLLERFKSQFDDVTEAPKVERVVSHLINTEGRGPVSQPVRRMSPLHLDELKTQLEELQRKGMIRPSTSGWSSPVLFARNGSGKLRFCVDYRAVNELTKRDRHPLPLIQDCFDQLGGAVIFSKFDLQQGFHQMKIDDNDVEKTAFGTRYGHYEWLVMPFGLANAPSTFQRMMNDILREYLDDFVQVYLDDILVYSKSEEEHLIHVAKVLEALEKAELKISGKKSVLCATEMQFVGHLISKDGIRVMPDKVEAIKEWPRPENVYDVRAFLGLAGYYRRFIKNFARIAAPLHGLTAGAVKKKAKIAWLPLHELAFITLKDALQTAPVLCTPDPQKPFVVETDASDYAVGAVLLQKGEDGVEHPVAFESAKLNPAQQNYPAQEKELLGILHAYRKWRVYLEGAVEETIVRTDHGSLVYLKTQVLPSRRLHRWIEEFAEMSIKVEYKKGSTNIVPDALSRRSDLMVIRESVEGLRDPSDWPLLIPYILEQREVPGWVSDESRKKAVMALPKFSYDRREETVMYIEGEQSPFIPFDMRGDLMESLHKQSGHRGRDGTLALLKGRGWWPGRYKDVEQFCEHCSQCQIFDNPKVGNESGRQYPLPSVEPFERWGADFIQLPESKEGFKWVLTIIDHSTGWPIVVPLKEATSANVADVFVKEIFYQFGVPSEILTDRGLNFLSKDMMRFYKGAHIRKLNTSGYHPRTNGKCERLNGILEKALFKLNNTGDETRWPEFLQEALFSVRINENTVTGWSPFELLYGVKPWLIGDQAKLRPAVLPDDASSASAAAEGRRARLVDLTEARRCAKDAQEVRAAENKARFDGAVDKRGTFRSYEVGELVKLRNESRTKGQPNWHGPFEVFDCLGGNVYRLVEPSGSLFPHPVNGNRLQPAKSKADALTEPWALPARLQVKPPKKDPVGKACKAEAAKLTRAQKKAARSRIRVVGRFASSATKPS